MRMIVAACFGLAMLLCVATLCYNALFQEYRPGMWFIFMLAIVCGFISYHMWDAEYSLDGYKHINK